MEETGSKNTCEKRFYNVHSKCLQERGHSDVSKELVCRFGGRGAGSLHGCQNVGTSQNI